MDIEERRRLESLEENSQLKSLVAGLKLDKRRTRFRYSHHVSIVEGPISPRIVRRALMEVQGLTLTATAEFGRHKAL